MWRGWSARICWLINDGTKGKEHPMRACERVVKLTGNRLHELVHRDQLVFGSRYACYYNL